MLTATNQRVQDIVARLLQPLMGAFIVAVAGAVDDVSV
jgi:hypothetical protein